MQLGEGSNYHTTNKDMIKLPHDVCVDPSNDPIRPIVEVVYPSLSQKYNDPEYMQERKIVTPKN